ncbi:MAG TPA: rhodanese-like domain-containing protein [Anaerolineales bacterium]|nr:rhodanese-like domain-containing protein [Anaerolineales bacterium]
MQRLAMVTLLALSLLAGACQAQVPEATSEESGQYTALDPAALADWMAREEVLLVNTHIPYEGEIPGTDAFLPYDEIDSLLDQLPADKSAPVVLYCRSGRMSAIAADRLSRLGFTNLFNLEGGMVAWEQAGYPLEMK